jgi:cell division protein FtsL
MKGKIRTFKETLEIRSSRLNRLRSHRFFLVGLLASAVLVVSCFHIWQRVKVMQLVKDVSALKTENANLVNEAKKLHAEIAALMMASRIERYAADSLGLRTATADRLFTLVERKRRVNRMDELDLVATALSRLSRYLPVVTENEARANQTLTPQLDTTSFQEGGK